MAELAILLFGTAGTAATAATATTAAVAATAATAGVIGTAGLVGGVVSLGTLASAGLTAASAFGAISSSSQRAQALEVQARQAELNSRLERLAGRQEALSIGSQLERDLASQNAIFASRGVLQGEGSSLAAQEEAKRRASRDIDVARFSGDIGAINAQERADAARAEAGATRQGGIFDATRTVAGFKRRPSLLSGG